MQAHLLVRTVCGRIGPYLDLKPWTTRPLGVGERRRCYGRAEGVFLEDARPRSHAIALLEVFLRDDAPRVEHERAGVRDALLLVARLDTVKRVLLDQVLLVQ